MQSCPNCFFFSLLLPLRPSPLPHTHTHTHTHNAPVRQPPGQQGLQGPGAITVKTVLYHVKCPRRGLKKEGGPLHSQEFCNRSNTTHSSVSRVCASYSWPPSGRLSGPITNTSCSIVMSERSQAPPSTPRQEMSSLSPTSRPTWTSRTYQCVELYTPSRSIWQRGKKLC